MADSTVSAAATLAGNAAPEGAAPATTPAAPATPPAAPAAAPAAHPAAPHWLGDKAAPELVELMKTKGLENPLQLAESYTNLEKLLGAKGDTVKVPKDPADKAAWDALHKALGRPDTADGYKLTVPDGDAGVFAKAAAGKFHELGLSATQAEGLNKWWNEHAAEVARREEVNRNAQADADMKDLARDWGQGYDGKIEEARRAMRELGLSRDDMTALENGGYGTGRFMRLMAKIGGLIGEDAGLPPGANGKGGIALTPAQAAAEIATRQNDAAFMKRYQAGDKGAIAEMERLHRAKAGS